MNNPVNCSCTKFSLVFRVRADSAGEDGTLITMSKARSVSHLIGFEISETGGQKFHVEIY